MPNVSIKDTKVNTGIADTSPRITVQAFKATVSQLPPGVSVGMPIGLLLALTYSTYDMLGKQPTTFIRSN